MSVPGADIEVDGAFVGNAPSTVTVAPGKHMSSVKKNGYTDWTRDMNVMGANAKVEANLEAKTELCAVLTAIHLRVINGKVCASGATSGRPDCAV